MGFEDRPKIKSEDRNDTLRSYDPQCLVIPKKQKKKEKKRKKYFNEIIPFVWQAIKWVRNTQAFLM